MQSLNELSEKEKKGESEEIMVKTALAVLKSNHVGDLQKCMNLD